MEFEYEFKFKIWRLALLFKKDKFMIGANAKRWAIGYATKEGKHLCWHVIEVI